MLARAIVSLYYLATNHLGSNKNWTGDYKVLGTIYCLCAIVHFLLLTKNKGICINLVKYKISYTYILNFGEQCFLVHLVEISRIGLFCHKIQGGNMNVHSIISQMCENTRLASVNLGPALLQKLFWAHVGMGLLGIEIWLRLESLTKIKK